MVVIMANSQVAISCFEINGVLGSPYSHSSSYYSSQWLPGFSVAINKKYVKPKVIILSCSTRRYGNIFALSRLNSNSGGSGIIDKEFEFKPSFDDYLKAMELAKIGKEKKQSQKSNKPAAKDNLDKRDAGRDEDTLERKKIRVNLDQEVVSKSVKRDGLQDRRIEYKKRETTKFNKELHGKESSVRSVETRKRPGERTGERHLKYTHRVIQKSSEHKTLRPGRERVSPRVLNDFHYSKATINVEEEFGHRVRFSNLEWKARTTSPKEIRSSVNEKHGIRNYNYTKLNEDKEEEISPRDRKSRSNRNFIVEDEDDVLLEERAAFRVSENLDEVVNKPRVPLREMEDRIQLLAKRLNGADIDMPEWMFSKTMHSARIKYSDHTILRTIQLLGKLGNWRRVLQVIEWLQTRERYKSYNLRKVYTTALDVLGKARRPVEALNVFHAMQQQKSTYPDLIAYRCVSVTLGQAGHIKELFDVMDTMRSPPTKKFKTGVIEKWDPRVEPDIVVYNAVLNACVQRKNWEGAFWVLQQLKQQNQQPSAASYGLVMEVMFACGKYNLVHEFFRKMQKSSIPTVLAYKVLINTLWKEGKTDEVVLAVEDLEKRGIVGSAALYYDFARCLCSSGRCKEALDQIDKICKVANKPLVVTYTGLMQACLDAGNVQNAVFIFDQMKNFCSPNVVTCNILLKGYLEHGMFEEAKTMFQKMFEDGKHITNKSDYKFRVIPDTFTFNTMLDACLVEKRWDDLEYVYGRMLQNGYHFNSKHHLRIVLEASRAGKENLVETTWKHFGQMDRHPPPPLTKEMFISKLAKGDHISAIYYVTSQPEPENELQAFSKGSWLKLFRENAQRFRIDSLIGLLDHAAIVTAGTNSSNTMLQNLLTACREYLRTNNVNSVQQQIV